MTGPGRGKDCHEKHRESQGRTTPCPLHCQWAKADINQVGIMRRKFSFPIINRFGRTIGQNLSVDPLQGGRLMEGSLPLRCGLTQYVILNMAVFPSA